MSFSVRTISRDAAAHTVQRAGDVTPVQRNTDPQIHPFQRPREYIRALNAVKLDKVFAKPFMGSLGAHTDAVCSMATLPTSLSMLVSGSCNGEVMLWNVPKKKLVWECKSHSGFVQGLALNHDSSRLFSCSTDKSVKVWALDPHNLKDTSSTPLHSFQSDYPLMSIDHHSNQSLFVTCGLNVDLWDQMRSAPIHSFNWGADTVSTVRFNQVETQIVAATASDRSVVLYDIRAKSPLRKVLLSMNSNALAWNPMEAFVFTVANEDHNLYTFDMRRLDEALMVHEDHVSAVMSLDYSPTGQEFVSGGYDRTVRIFRADHGHSREAYHAKRMQRVFTVRFSGDAQYVYSGSDDTNIRVWKAEASRKLGALLPRERKKLEYSAKLKEKFQEAPEVRRIARHRHMPKAVYGAQKLKHTMRQARVKKESHRSSHSRKNAAAGDETDSFTRSKTHVRRRNIVKVSE